MQTARTLLPAALLAALLALALPGRAAAQEVQVPLDARGRVETVDARLAARLGMWTADHPGFRAARLFRGPDGHVLEITTEVDGRTARERIALTDAEAAALRERVAVGLGERSRVAGGQAGARATLLGGSTLLGLGFYGWAVPAAFDVEDDAGTAASLYMITAAGSFFVPWLLTSDDGVTWGESNAVLYGASRGPVHGLLLADVVSGGGGASDGSGRIATATLFGVGEAVAGAAVARRWGLRASHVHAMGLGGDLGMGYGVGTGVLFGLNDGDDEERALAALGLGGAAAGMVAGNAVGARGDLSWGDVEALRAATLVGALGGGAAAALADAGSDQAYAGAIMAGGTAGLWMGSRLMRDRDLSVPDGVLLDLGSLAGGALGLGIAHVADFDRDDGRWYATSAALGAAAGFAATFRAVGAGPDAFAAGGGRWSVRVSPEALAAGALLGGDEADRGPGAPLVTVDVRF